MGVDPDRVLLTNGGAEAIALVAAELGPAGSTSPSSRSTAATLGSRRRRPAGARTPTTRPGCWPRRRQRRRVGRGLLPAGHRPWTRGDGRRRGRFADQAAACPGLRVGYVLVPPPRSSNRSPAAAGLVGERPGAGALPEMLATVHLPSWSARIADARLDLVAVLLDRGLVARPSDSPWLLVDLVDLVNPPRTLPDRLPGGACPRGCGPRWPGEGVLVRDCTSFGMPTTVRIAVPAPSDLAASGLAPRPRSHPPAAGPRRPHRRPPSARPPTDLLAKAVRDPPTSPTPSWSTSAAPSWPKRRPAPLSPTWRWSSSRGALDDLRAIAADVRLGAVTNTVVMSNTRTSPYCS